MARWKWIVVALVLVALAAGWYVVSPLYTLSAMQKAARSGDSEAFSAYVDFPALRADLKTELTARLAREAEKDKTGLGRLGAAFGAAMVGPMVDAAVSPEGIRAGFVAGRSAAGSAGSRSGGAVAVPEKPVIRRRGLSEFLVASKDEPEGGLVFARHGLGWKLSGVDLPPDATPRLD